MAAATLGAFEPADYAVIAASGERGGQPADSRPDCQAVTQKAPGLLPPSTRAGCQHRGDFTWPPTLRLTSNPDRRTHCQSGSAGRRLHGPLAMLRARRRQRQPRQASADAGLQRALAWSRGPLAAVCNLDGACACLEASQSLQQGGCCGVCQRPDSPASVAAVQLLIPPPTKLPFPTPLCRSCPCCCASAACGAPTPSYCRRGQPPGPAQAGCAAST